MASFIDFLGIRFICAENGRSELALLLEPHHMNGWQVTHGGISMTLLDNAMGYAGRSPNPDAGASITVEMKTSFLRPAGRPGQNLLAFAEVIQRTATLCFCEAELRLDDQLVAKASGTFKFPKKRPEFPGRDRVQGCTAIIGPVQIAAWTAVQDIAVPIRFKVFVDEQQVPAELELDEHDAVSLHGIVRDAAGLPVATGRLLPDGHIGRMAVLPAARGSGVGSALLLALIEAARKLGHRQVVLSAQCQAVAFYQRHGFTETGPVYEEAGIRHVDMALALLPH